MIARGSWLLSKSSLERASTKILPLVSAPQASFCHNPHSLSAVVLSGTRVLPTKCKCCMHLMCMPITPPLMMPLMVMANIHRWMSQPKRARMMRPSYAVIRIPQTQWRCLHASGKSPPTGINKNCQLKEPIKGAMTGSQHLVQKPHALQF